MALAACGNDPASPPQPEPTVTQAADPVPVSGPERTVLAFGDSLFAGYGLKVGEGYPARLEAALRSQGINATVIDAGVSGDTSAAARQRASFVLDSLEAAPDLVIVEFGGNDILRALPPAETRENLTAILTEVRDRKIPVVLMGMRAPPNLGSGFAAEFDAIYPALARQFGATLVPFFLEAVYDKPALLQQDHIHPTAEGIDALVTATVGSVAGALPKAE
jgi:acyl-CoA thioesterase-1